MAVRPIGLLGELVRLGEPVRLGESTPPVEIGPHPLFGTPR